MSLHQKHSTFSCLLAGLGDFFMSVPLHETLFHRAKCAKLDYFKVPYSRFLQLFPPTVQTASAEQCLEQVQGMS